MEEFLKELRDALIKYDVDYSDEIVDKYRNRFLLGLEAGLSEAEIKDRLGNPETIAIEEKHRDENWETDSLLDGYNVKIVSNGDDIDIEYVDSGIASVRFDESTDEKYDVELLDNKLSVICKKKRYVGRRREKGSIIIKLPLHREIKEIALRTQGGSIKIDTIRANTLKTNTINGDVLINEIYANTVNMKTASGDIEIELVDAKYVKTETVSGDVVILNLMHEEKGSFYSATGNIDIKTSNEKKISATSFTGRIVVRGDVQRSIVGQIGAQFKKCGRKIKQVFKS